MSTDLGKHADVCSDEMLLCCKCRQLLDDPVQLQCLHNCCRRCLDAATAAEDACRVVTCPVCSHVADISSATCNAFISARVSCFKTLMVDSLCDPCRARGYASQPATAWCRTCSHCLCAGCMPYHSLYNKDHATVSLEEVGSLDDPRIMPVLKCTQHGKPFDLLCVTCETTKCPDCWAKCGKDRHEIQRISDPGTLAHVVKLKEELIRLDTDLQSLSKMRRERPSRLQELHVARTAHLDEIERRKKLLLDAVDIVSKAAVDAVEDMYGMLEQEATGVDAAATLLDKKVSHALAYGSCLVDSNDVCSLLLQQKQLLGQLTSLLCEAEAIRSKLDVKEPVLLDGSKPVDLNELVSVWIGKPRLYTDTGEGRSLSEIRHKLRKARTLLINELTTRDVLHLTDFLYQDMHIFEAQKDEIQEHARRNSRASVVRCLVDIVDSLGDGAILALVDCLESETMNRKDLAQMVRDMSA